MDKFTHGVHRSQLMFLDSSPTAETSHVTSTFAETPDTMTSSAAPALTEGLVMTSAPDAPISAQLIQSTIAPFLGMEFFEFFFTDDDSKNTRGFLKGILELHTSPVLFPPFHLPY